MNDVNYVLGLYLSSEFVKTKRKRIGKIETTIEMERKAVLFRCYSIVSAIESRSDNAGLRCVRKVNTCHEMSGLFTNKRMQ